MAGIADYFAELVALREAVENLSADLGAPLKALPGTISPGWTYRIPVNSRQSAFFECETTNDLIVLHLATPPGNRLRSWRTPYVETPAPDIYG